MAKNATIALLIVILGYDIWAFFVSNRYVSLCNLSSWSATPDQKQACKELTSELDTQRR